MIEFPIPDFQNAFYDLIDENTILVKSEDETGSKHAFYTLDIESGYLIHFTSCDASRIKDLKGPGNGYLWEMIVIAIYAIDI